ncbi:M4 family metallopeptidase [Ruegeria sp. HKCCD8929]|uniref:M4 family metallopeptidase n=1 Tax=Ruegeria sp. HKCCD8929 TaxID=2683006 RepID=UPI001489AF56|nr:M4 family metallopeptidase [Ruegeria sp. HKCCD8929]
MAAKYKTFTFNAAGAPSESSLAAPTGLQAALADGSQEAVGGPPSESPVFQSDEMAARYYAKQLLVSAKDSELTDVIAPEDTSTTPGLVLTRAEELPAAGARSVHFEQQARGIPVFGTNAVVELEAYSRRLNSFDAVLTNSPDVSPVATLSAAQALDSIRAFSGATLEAVEVEAPVLCYFATQDGGDWHLTFHFKSVPGAPRETVDALSEGHGHGIGPSPREHFLMFDYLVDAHSGEIVYYFSSQPFLDIPVLCQGDDDIGIQRDFHGRTNGNGFEMVDPLRNIETFDHSLNDITSPPTATPIDSAATDFMSSNPAGVSAHFHATLVFDFFNNVLKRNGIDGKGMRLISMVNCTYSQHSPPPVWKNAVWWNKRMWYGQTQNSTGQFESYARHLDVIAHELSHGVTETTSNLVYRDESGALNESFSDIFGILVKNWYPDEPKPLRNWNWELGSGLGNGGLPLRDMENPARTGDPDHWSQRRHIGTPFDNGGVHINSNIHNKAAYNLFNSQDANGDPLLQPGETGLLYYLTLTRLSRMATFRDCRRTLRSAALTYFRGDPAKSADVQAAINSAYASVGIV